MHTHTHTHKHTSIPVFSLTTLAVPVVVDQIVGIGNSIISSFPGDLYIVYLLWTFLHGLFVGYSHVSSLLIHGVPSTDNSYNDISITLFLVGSAIITIPINWISIYLLL